MAQGSGFFISADGYIVTNNHVVNNAKSVEVVTEDGKTIKAKIIGTDPKTDLALLKVDGGNHPFVEAVRIPIRSVGDWVIAVGNPFGLGGTVTAGIVSANGRDIGEGPYDDFIQIDAPVNRGNSGGPAFDVDGKVIGVTTAIYSPSGGSVGIGFAIPAETVTNVVTQIKEHGHVTRGWIGVQIQPVTKDIADSLGMTKAEGALVAQPQPRRPRGRGRHQGRRRDRVGQRQGGEGRARSRQEGGGDRSRAATASFGILRNGKSRPSRSSSRSIRRTRQFASNEPDKPRPFQRRDRGARPDLAPASSVDGAGDKGVVVTDVNPAGPAAEHGIRSGDVILDVAGKSVSTAEPGARCRAAGAQERQARGADAGEVAARIPASWRCRSATADLQTLRLR